MGDVGQAPNERRPPNILSLALIGILVQAGCVTFVLVGVAIVAGLWLDALLNTRPLFTVVLVLVSVPITMYLLYKVAVAGAARLQQQSGIETTSKSATERENGRNT